MGLFLATLVLVAITFIPALELRFSIPVGVLAGSVSLPFFGRLQGFGLPVWYVFLVCVLANILLAALAYWFLHLVVHRLLLPYWPWFARFYHKQVETAQRKIHKSIERWGWLGVAVFIGVPLPGTGVYTAALASYAMGMKFKEFFLASVLGVLLSGVAVLLLTLGFQALLTI